MKRILFIHHSTGGLLIRFGQVRQILKRESPELEFWDHSYNLYASRLLSMLLGPVMYRTGLSDANGNMTGKDFDIVISNNSPKEYAEIFSRDPSDLTLKQILDFDIVIFKNCFPTSGITSDNQLLEYKEYYQSIFKSLAKYSNTFIVFTQPPLRKETTSIDQAARARELATWMVSQEKIISKNVSVFNFFDLLSDNKGTNNNMLRRKYCSIIPFDSHPNIRANADIGKIFVDFLVTKG